VSFFSAALQLGNQEFGGAPADLIDVRANAGQGRIRNRCVPGVVVTDYRDVVWNFESGFRDRFQGSMRR
jgi:hypothetical protein